MDVLRSTFLCCLLVSCDAVGYELATHSRISKQIYLQSALFENAELLTNIGLRTELDLSERYYDVYQSQVYERAAQDFVLEERFLPELGEAGDLGISEDLREVYPNLPVGWLMRGSIREDDHTDVENLLCNYQAPNPQGDDPYGEIARVFHHFYDPFHKEALPHPFEDPETLVDWALGTNDAIEDINDVNEGRRNHFSLPDAKEAMYRALTGMSLEGSKNIGENGAESNRAIRIAYWATMFRSLGNILHLLEDGGQPQHTRGDKHGGGACSQIVEPLIGPKSSYERYSDARARGEVSIALSGQGSTREPITELVYEVQPSYPIPSFATYRDYFTTALGDAEDLADLQQGRGMTDFSNREFFSAGTNLGHNRYESPSNSASQYTEEQISMEVTGMETVSHYYLTGDVTDNVGPGVTEVPLTTLSVTDTWKTGSQVKEYTLTAKNYKAQADILVPRAVAYGAGLINHFFRGRLDFGDAGQGIWSMVDHSTPHTMSGGLPINNETGEVFGFTKIRMTVRNDTPAIETPDGTTVPQDMTDGFLQAVVKYNLNYCYEPDLKGQFPPDAFDTEGTVPLDDGFTYSGCNGYEVLLDQNQPHPGLNQVEDQVEALEKVSVSKRISVDELSRTADRLFEFDFRDDPIPINAREVRLQVVYRGKLGSGDAVEEDAIAVETADIREPTYWTYANGTDYVRINGTLMTYDAAISALNNYISQETDDDERDALIDFRDGLTDPSVPLINFACESGVGNVEDFVKTEEIEVKEFVRVALLTNMGSDTPSGDNTEMGDCEFVETRTDGQTDDTTAYFFGHTVKNHTDHFRRDNEVFLFTQFPLFRGTVLKQGGDNFYDAFGWGVFFNNRLASEERFPETTPPDEVKDIADPLVAEPVPVELHCDYTWEECS